MPQLTIIEQPLLDRYASAWDALVDQAPLPTPFLRSWWLEHTSCGRPVFVLVLEGEVLVGGIALQEERRRGGTRLRFMGSGPLCPDHLDLLAAEGREAEVVDAFRASLTAREPAIVDLDGLRAGAFVTDCFDKRTVFLSNVAPFLALDGPASLVGRPTRARWRKKYGLVHRVVAAEDADVALSTVRSLHELRWGQESRFLPEIERFESAAREWHAPRRAPGTRARRARWRGWRRSRRVRGAECRRTGELLPGGSAYRAHSGAVPALLCWYAAWRQRWMRDVTSSIFFVAPSRTSGSGRQASAASTGSSPTWAAAGRGAAGAGGLDRWLVSDSGPTCTRPVSSSSAAGTAS